MRQYFFIGTLRMACTPIDGMMCGMCEAHICDTIRKVYPQAKKVCASRAKGEAVFLSEQAVPAHMLAHALKKTGYQLKSLESEPLRKKGLFAGRRHTS